MFCRENSSIDGGAKQWIYWDPSNTRKRNDPTSPWFNFTDKYHPIFELLDDSDDKQDFWKSVAACMKNRENERLRLNKANENFPTSCLEENLNQNSNISPEISSSKFLQR